MVHLHITRHSLNQLLTVTVIEVRLSHGLCVEFYRRSALRQFRMGRVIIKNRRLGKWWGREFALLRSDFRVKQGNESWNRLFAELRSSTPPPSAPFACRLYEQALLMYRCVPYLRLIM